MIQTRGAYME